MKKESACKHAFNVSGKKVTVYPSASPDKPVIYLNSFGGDGDNIYQLLQKDKCPDFTLVVISQLVWDRDMAPWDIPPISKLDTPCTGGADEYLHILTDEIIPEAEKRIQGKVLWRGIAGYSLAGLFAVYSIYHTDIFSRIASMSGSLWFPDFKEYVFSHDMKGIPDCFYFSLGDKESKTRNTFLKSVRDNTESIAEFYRQKGIDTEFQLNPGNHYKNAAQRSASGIEWILNR